MALQGETVYNQIPIKEGAEPIGSGAMYNQVPMKQQAEEDGEMRAVKVQEQSRTTTTTTTTSNYEAQTIPHVQQQQVAPPIAIAIPRVEGTVDDLSKGGGAPTTTRNANNVVPMARLIERPKLNLCDAYILHIALGLFGGLHFRMGRPVLGLLYFFTVGGFGWGYVVDLFRLPALVADYNAKNGKLWNNESEATIIGDCYALWVLNFFGAVHFYLGRFGWGLFYFLTCGGFGVGFLVDTFRIPLLVREFTQDKARSEIVLGGARSNEQEYSLLDAYILMVPCGLFGAHHFYLRNYQKGVLYFFTFGLFGLGWCSDLVQLPRIVREANEARTLHANTPVAEASAVV